MNNAQKVSNCIYGASNGWYMTYDWTAVNNEFVEILKEEFVT
jgi:hypothetical protein